MRPQQPAPFVDMGELAGIEPVFDRIGDLIEILAHALLHARVFPGCGAVEDRLRRLRFFRILAGFLKREVSCLQGAQIAGLMRIEKVRHILVEIIVIPEDRIQHRNVSGHLLGDGVFAVDCRDGNLENAGSFDVGHRHAVAEGGPPPLLRLCFEDIFHNVAFRIAGRRVHREIDLLAVRRRTRFAVRRVFRGPGNVQHDRFLVRFFKRFCQIRNVFRPCCLSKCRRSRSDARKQHQKNCRKEVKFY